MYRHYEKTFRIIVPQITTLGKHYLSDADTKKLLGGQVILTEKLDGANTGLIRHKDYFKLQKRGSLVDASEHAQFNFFKAWSQVNHDKIMAIPENTTLYCELMYARHTINYTKLPDFIIAFAWYDKKTDTYYHRDDMVALCDKIGISYAPEIARGHFSKMDLFDLIPDPSCFGDEPAEGLVVWNYKNNMRGKIVREQFQKSMDNDGHWKHKAVVKNKLAPK